MPLDERHPAPVSQQIFTWLCHVILQPILRNLPHLYLSTQVHTSTERLWTDRWTASEAVAIETNRTVLRTGGDAAVVKRVPLHVQNTSAVTAHACMKRTHAPRLKHTHVISERCAVCCVREWAWSYLMDRNDNEGPTPHTLCHYGDEVWIHGTEVVVLDTVRDCQAMVAPSLYRSLSDHVTKPCAGVSL